MSKICTKCLITKEINEFYKNKSASDGHDTQCKDCTYATNKTRRERIAKEEGRRIVQSPKEAKKLLHIGLKRCPECKETKSINYFSKNRASKDGLGSHCLICSGLLSKQYLSKEEQKETYQRDKEKVRETRLLSKFGITINDYKKILMSQAYKCAICGCSEKDNGKKFAVDHSHETNQIRGLLCGVCNAAIGFLQESAKRSRSAANYLERWNPMGYMKIQNLYKSQDILAFKRCFALEKIHGSSSSIILRKIEGKEPVHFFSGGASHANFIKLFDAESLYAKFLTKGVPEAVVYGEAYGGSMQGMSSTYGKELKFIAFDVTVGDCWLSVPDMAEFATSLGLEVVDFVEGPSELAFFDEQRDRPSVQAKRNGIMEDRPREGVVIRPPFEVTKNNGERVMCKHKQDAFSERATPQKVIDPAKLQVLTEATAIADEWVTMHRLEHVLQKLPSDINMEGTGQVIKAMIEDVTREAAGEIVDTPDARKAIGKKAAELFKGRLRARLKEIAS